MRVQGNSALIFLSIVLALTSAPAELLAGCYQPDAPDCDCFYNNGAWNPAGAFIQDVAIDTLGTEESCRCPSTTGCDWGTGRDPFRNSGKPYYQMVLGANSGLLALFKAWQMSQTGGLIRFYYEEREAWCSEAISYWHRQADIPYPGGYRHCGWHCNWLNQNVGELRRWYATEERAGGRGRWMNPGELDYDDYVLGVTLPVPGAYVAWRAFDDSNDTWISDGGSHSLMINEMWIHEVVPGTAFRVEVRLLEGNSGNEVKSTRRWDDLLSVTPQGSEWIEDTSNKKIYGFGIDLNSRGQPAYDESRLHFVKWPEATSTTTRTVEIKDPTWAQYYEPYLPGLEAYARLMQQAGEPNVTASTGALKISGIPDGGQVKWGFPKGLSGGAEVLIDLLDIHPLPVKGMELSWSSSGLPGDYRVEFATAGQPFQEAEVPKIPDPDKYPGQLPSGSSVLVPAVFARTGNGAQVRYVKLTFPRAFEEEAILQELRFRYYKGPLADTEVCDYTLLGDLDNNCRVDFYDVALMAGNWLIDCAVSPEDPSCVNQ